MRGLVANRWALFPVLMLAGSVLLGVVTVMAAVGSEGAVEPDYYRKGAAWDEHRAQLAANGALGWTLTPSITPSDPSGLPPVVTLAVRDKHGVAIEGAEVDCEVVPIAAAEQRLVIPMRETEPGSYAGACPIRTAGWWEVRSRVVWRGKVYMDRVRRHVQDPMGKRP